VIHFPDLEQYGKPSVVMPYARGVPALLEQPA